jgi:hypothetical protein
VSIKYLDIPDLDKLIDGLEKKWGISTMEMLGKSAVRGNIPEIVLLQWETYVRQRILLREHYKKLRADYLSHIPRSSGSGKALTPKELSELAA